MAKKKKTEHKPREYSKRQLSQHKRQLRRQRLFFFGGIAIIVVIIGIILGGWLIGEYLPLHKTVIEVFDKKFDTAYYIDTLVFYGRNAATGDLTQIASSVAGQIITEQLLIQKAAELGIVVSDEEAAQYLQAVGMPVDAVTLNLAKGQLLPDRLKSMYFSNLVPATDNQVHVMAMLVESDAVAAMLREKIINGENFTLLAEEYAQNYYSKQNGGDFGWHPIDVLEGQLGSEIPLEYIKDMNVKPGDVSPPLSDNESYKKLGYWLIRVNEKSDEGSANVSAIYLSDEETAISVRSRLEAGEELAVIADTLSQYSPTKVQHGELGVVYNTENITDIFNGYVFSPTVEIGQWSQPLWDDALWSQGGAWVVKVVDRDEDRALSAEDRDTRIENLYSEWWTKMQEESASFLINHLLEDTELDQWAIERASRQL
ncbi:MAG: peptidylprolyl isomerase [Dehalococcoidales bacterium]|nr:peptidylprolyl isomerase [Dehalococcoidales bacterium]